MNNLLQLPATNDERILCDLMRQMTWQTDIDASHIRAEVSNGVVHLRGTVQTCMEIVEAEHAAQAVYGVTRVINHLEVHAEHRHTDKEIARDLAIALRNTSTVLDQIPTVTVNDGVVVLTGVCRWQFQRLCAERTALSIIGVRSVVNLIAVGSCAASAGQPACTGLHLIGKAS